MVTIRGKQLEVLQIPPSSSLRDTSPPCFNNDILIPTNDPALLVSQETSNDGIRMTLDSHSFGRTRRLCWGMESTGTCRLNEDISTAGPPQITETNTNSSSPALYQSMANKGRAAEGVLAASIIREHKPMYDNNELIGRIINSRAKESVELEGKGQRRAREQGHPYPPSKPRPRPQNSGNAWVFNAKP
ncbi:hypothetical protein C8J56DRAFT_956639 [Mycena floridula]|nr:hypothetical protein C8J56DRAFT_956639 [Mycena floridula]